MLKPTRSGCSISSARPSGIPSAYTNQAPFLSTTSVRLKEPLSCIWRSSPSRTTSRGGRSGGWCLVLWKVLDSSVRTRRFRPIWVSRDKFSSLYTTSNIKGVPDFIERSTTASNRDWKAMRSSQSILNLS
jgi:hypothetical protein